MSNINRLILLGRIVKDIESRTFESGAVIYKFSLAVNRWDKKQNKEIADFFDVQTFSKLSPHLEKGMLIAIDGRMITNVYKNEQNETRKRYIVDANTVEICAKKKDNSESSQDNDLEGIDEQDLIGEEELPF